MVADIYIEKSNNRNTRKMYEIYSKFTLKTPVRRHWRRSGVFIVNFKQISHLFLVFPLLTSGMYLFAGGGDKNLWNNQSPLTQPLI